MANHSERVLITGGLGYVGGRLAKHLADATPELSLRLMTRRSPKTVPTWAKKLDVVQADLRASGTLEAAVQDIDTLIHLGAVDEIESQRDPETALDVNGAGTYRLLQACKAQGVERFIYLSTFHVYGPGAAQPITENTPTRPIHPYAITHRLAEDMVNWHRHSFGMETLILRLSNGYGYPADPLVQRWTLVFNDLCKQAVQNKAIFLKSSGTQHRDFISLTDVGRAVEHFLALPNAAWQDGLFNLGGDCSMSILQVAEQVASQFSQRFGEQIPITTTGIADGAPPSPVCFNIDKLKGSGFSLDGNMSEEVDTTFDICKLLERQES